MVPQATEIRVNPRVIGGCTVLAWVTGIFAIALGGMGLIGWIIDSGFLKGPLSQGIVMKTNTAICLILSGVVLLLSAGRKKSSLAKVCAQICGVFIALVGAITIAEHLTGFNFRIDQILFTEPPGVPATTSPNRMGPPASICFLLYGVAVWLLDYRTKRGKSPSQYLAMVIGMIALIPLMGYAYSVEPLYGISKYTGIATETAAALGAMAIGLLAARPAWGVMAILVADDAGGLMARKLIVPAVVIPFLLGWIRTRAQQLGYIDEAFGRPALILLMTVIFTALIWSSAREIGQLGRNVRGAKEEAERANNAKDEFIAMLSHELRTPLTPALLSTALLEADPQLPAHLRESVATIRQSIDLENHLIGDLLDLTRMAKGKFQLDVQDVDLHEVIRAAIAVCPMDGGQKLVVELEAGQHFARGDSTRLQQVIWNLLSNAQKFTPKGGQIAVRTRDLAGRQIQIEISDTGMGIDAAILPRLFSAFEQGEARGSLAQAGLGLGLAISRKIIESHGGEVSASSDGRDKGATFTIVLSTIPASTISKLQDVDSKLVIAERRLRILLVEDHEPTARVLSTLLRRVGHTVSTANSVARGIAAARAEEFDLLVSDVGLPDGSGLDLIRELRDQYAGRAIALTGFGMEEDVQKTRAGGFAMHLTKPVQFSELTAAIESCFASKG